jgi:hypothetical protein
MLKVGGVSSTVGRIEGWIEGGGETEKAKSPPPEQLENGLWKYALNDYNRFSSWARTIAWVRLETSSLR